MRSKITIRSILKWTAIICVVLLAVEMIYLIYQKYGNNKDKTYYDTVNDLVKVKDGYITAGGSDFFNSHKYNYTNGYEKGKLVKYTTDMRTVFETRYDRGYNVTFYSVIEVKDGYLVTGSGEYSEEQTTNHNRDALLVKYDSNGKMLWEKTFQILGNSKFVKALEVDDGYIVIGQSILPNDEVGITTNGGGVIVKFSTKGDIIWQSNFGGGKSGTFNDLIKLNDALYVVGKDAVQTGLIVKYDLNGNRQWIKNYDVTDSFGFSAIASFNNEKLVIVGGNKVEKDKFDYDTDALVTIYDLDGNLEKETLYRGEGMERFNDVVVDDNTIIVTGHTAVRSASLSTEDRNVFLYDGLYMRYSLDGNLLSKETFGGSKDEYQMGLIKDDNQYLVFGYSNSNDKNLKKTEANGKDFFPRFFWFNSSGKIQKVK